MRATFPAGTVSGSPKIRAMQIIADQEPTCRGTYAGAVGYFGFSGNLDSCIAIRTVLLKDGKAYLQAGGGLGGRFHAAGRIPGIGQQGQGRAEGAGHGEAVLNGTSCSSSSITTIRSPTISSNILASWGRSRW